MTTTTTTKTLSDETRQAIEAALEAVRETPIGNGRTVWDLLADERSRRAVEIAERYIAGEATYEQLEAAAWEASDAAAADGSDAAAVASAAAWAAADAAWAPAWAARAARYAAYAAAEAAQA